MILHARAAAEPPAELATSGFFRAVSKRGGGLPAIDGHLSSLAADAAEAVDPLRVLSTVWVRKRLKNHVTEELTLGGAGLLVRTGRTAQAWAALPTLDSGDWRARSARHSLVEALGATGQVDVAQALIAEVPEDQQAGLRGGLAVVLAPREPARALALAKHASFGDVVQLAGVLASRPGFVDAAWQLAERSAVAQHAVVRAAAAHDLQRAAVFAKQVESYDDRTNGQRQTRGTDSAVADVGVAAAVRDPELAARLVDELGVVTAEPVRVAYALALQGDVDRAQSMAAQETNSDALRQLVRAAAVAGCSRSTGSPAESPALGQPSNLCGHRYDTDVIARLDLERLRHSEAASALAAEALHHVAKDVLERPFADDCEAGCAALGEALAVFDLPGALAFAEEAVKLLGSPARHVILARIVGRITARDGKLGWELARREGTHGVSMAWARALPSDAVEWAADRIEESIERRYSSTRVALAGQLADKLGTGGDRLARRLLDLLPAPAESALFEVERDAFAASVIRAIALRGVRDVPVPRMSSEPLMHATKHTKIEAEALLAIAAGASAGRLEQLTSRASEVAALARISGTIGGRVIEPLVAAAAELSREGEDLPRALLADSVVALAEDAPDVALELARDIGSPVYKPSSAHQPAWMAFEAAAERLRRAWDLAPPSLGPTALEQRVASLLEARGAACPLAVAIEVLGRSQNPSAAQATESWLRQRDVHAWTTLRAFRRVAAGALDPDEIDGILGTLDAWSATHLICRTAVSAPREALRLCHAWFDAKRDDSPFLDVLAAIAATDPTEALSQWEQFPWPSGNAVVSDALQAIAVVIARRDWDAALGLLDRMEHSRLEGHALYDLAALAATFEPRERRVAALAQVLARASTLPHAAIDDAIRGLLLALEQAGAPDPALLVGAIELAGQSGEFERYIGDLAALVATASDPDDLVDALDRVDRVLLAVS